MFGLRTQDARPRGWDAGSRTLCVKNALNSVLSSATLSDANKLKGYVRMEQGIPLVGGQLSPASCVLSPQIK